MVQQQLCSLEQLKTSGFGRPFPRHGLQLLFWFANRCVIFQPPEEDMKMASDCRPEAGVYGFHRFGNVEELLPVIPKAKTKRSKQYFELGNLNPGTYRSSANLPDFVKENFGFDCAQKISNIDRLIICLWLKSRLVEAIYITEHGTAIHGRFRPDHTYQVGPDLVKALQNPELDVSDFLTRMGYYQDTEADPAAELLLCMLHADDHGFLSETLNQNMQLNFDPFGYNRRGFNVESYQLPVVSSRPSKRGKKKRRNVKKAENLTEPELVVTLPAKRTASKGEEKKWKFWKILLGLGGGYLAARWFSRWLRNIWNRNLVQMVTPKYSSPALLDY